MTLTEKKNYFCRREIQIDQKYKYAISCLLQCYALVSIALEKKKQKPKNMSSFLYKNHLKNAVCP